MSCAVLVSGARREDTSHVTPAQLAQVTCPQTVRQGVTPHTKACLVSSRRLHEPISRVQDVCRVARQRRSSLPDLNFKPRMLGMLCSQTPIQGSGSTPFALLFILGFHIDRLQGMMMIQMDQADLLHA